MARQNKLNAHKLNANKLGERKRRIKILDGDTITLVDKYGNACLTIEFRGPELMLGIDIIGGDADTSNPIGLRVDPSLVGHKWQEANR